MSRDGGVIEHRLPNGQITTVDAADAVLLTKYRFRAMPRVHTTYVAARVGKQNLYLHRWLMGAGAGQVVHHRDRNGLNNCRSNLVLTDQSTNIGNKRVLKPTKTGYRGVHLRAKDGRYVAEIKVGYRKRYLGSFAAARDAAQAYNAAATEAWGEHAVLNELQSAKDGGSGCPGTVM